jgi:hypothetical protein
VSIGYRFARAGPEQLDLLKFVEDRYSRKVTFVTCLQAVDLRHGAMSGLTFPGTFRDKIAHNNQRLPLLAESLRRRSRVKERLAGLIKPDSMKLSRYRPA